MASTTFCSTCGRPVAAGERFCGFCGAEQHPAGAPGRAGGPAAAEETRAPPAEPSARARRYEVPTARAAEPGPLAEQEELAGMGTRTGAFLLTALLPGLLGWIPVLGWLAAGGLSIWSLFLYRRGQDVGARLLGLRVLRDNGDLAGFFHMWTRRIVAFLSLIVVGAGYWVAYFDPDRRTWHDKIMKTYVVVDGPHVSDRPGTSSGGAIGCFWLSVVLGVVGLILAVLIGLALLAAL